MITVTATLKKDGVFYDYVAPFYKKDATLEDQEYVDFIEYNWTEGNFGCDCNRAECISLLETGDYLEEDPRCGQTIELIKLMVEESGRRILLYQKPLDVGTLKDWVVGDIIIVPGYEMPRWE